ncbi:MAG TPA: MFS transporter [Anaerolineaceae bacterium]
MNPSLPLAGRSPAAALLRGGIFRSPGLAWFILADSLNNLGNVFYQVALPVLAAEVAGTAGAAGQAILISGAGRMGLVLFAGMLCDRISPRRLLLGAGLARAALFAAAALRLAFFALDLPELYALCLASGACDAVSAPARAALVPRLTGQADLQAANAACAFPEKVLGLVGPVLAGGLIAALDTEFGAGKLAALAVSALAAAGSALILSRGRAPFTEGPAEWRGSSGPALQMVTRLAREAARGGPLGAAFGTVLGVNALSAGPLGIGLPVFALGHFPEGARTLGWLLSALGCGSLLGTVLAGLLPSIKKIPPGRLGAAAFGLIGLGLAALFSAPAVGAAAAAALFTAAAASMFTIATTARVQALTPRELLGTAMGILNFK